MLGHFIRSCSFGCLSFRSGCFSYGNSSGIGSLLVSVLGYCLMMGMLSYWGGSVIGNLFCF